MPIEIPGEFPTASVEALRSLFMARGETFVAVDIHNPLSGQEMFVLVAVGADRDAVKARLQGDLIEVEEPVEDAFPADIARALVPVVTGAQDTAQARPRPDGSPKPVEASSPYDARGNLRVVDGIQSTALPSDGIGGA